MNGKILLDRKILDWEWWSDVNTTRLFIYLLLKANWKDTRWRGQKLKRGSLVTSYASLANETQLSPMQVRRCINNLITTGEITKETTSKNTVIFVVNYDVYQTFQQVEEQAGEQSKEQTNNIETTLKQHLNNKQTTTDEEYKKDNKGKKEINIPPISPQGESKKTVEDMISKKGFSDRVSEVVTDWARYKKERRDGYKETGLRMLLTQIENNIREYGEDAVVGIIMDSMSSGYKGICWDRLKNARKKPMSGLEAWLNEEE